MEEKDLNAIMDIVKSDELRTYFKKIMDDQTESIISAINAVEEKRIQKDNDELRNKLSQEMSLCNDLKQKYLEYELQNNNLNLLLSKKNAEFERLEAEYRVIEKKVFALNMENEKLVDLLSEERMKTETSSIAWEKERKHILDKLGNLENRFSDVNNLYEQYNVLPESIKKRLSNIFSSDNVYSMIVATSDWNCIEGLWGFTKRRIIEDETESLQELISLFVKAFCLFTTIDGSKRYELISPSIGDKYDSDKHSIKGIKTDGTISNVLLNGIYDSVLKKTVYKAVVQIL